MGVPALTCSSLSLRRFCRSSISASARVRSLAAWAAFLLNLSVSCSSYRDRGVRKAPLLLQAALFISFFLWMSLLLSSDRPPATPCTRSAKSQLICAVPMIWQLTLALFGGQVGRVLHQKEQGLIFSSLFYSLPWLVSLWTPMVRSSLLWFTVLIS